MSLIQEKIRSIGQDSSLRIALSTNDDFIGYQQEIDKLAEDTAANLINSINDVEVRKFKPNFNSPVFSFYFRNMINFNNAYFTDIEISGQSSNFINSFFILDYYDSYDTNTQQKIFTTYLTNLGFRPTYLINNKNQLYPWYIPISYTEQQTGTTCTGYTKFSFYNAKLGKITEFYNQINANIPPVSATTEVQYFKTKLDLINKSWEILDMPIYPTHYINIIELTGSTQYNNRIDSTFVKYSDVVQQYPTGNTYDYKTNKYIIPSV